MTGMNVAQTDYHVGQRIVAGRDARTNLEGDISYGEMRMETVESIDEDARGRGNNARMTLRHGDETRTVLLCWTKIDDRTVQETPWRTLWSEPLPVDDAQALAYVRAVTSTETYRSVALLWIGAVKPDGGAYAHMLTETHEQDAERGRCVRESPGMHYGAHPISVRGGQPLIPRTLVAARLTGAEGEDGVVVHEVRILATIVEDVTLVEAASAMPVQTRRPGCRGTHNLVGWFRINEEEDRALARTEPSEALTLCWMDGGSAVVKCLAKTGIDFWNNDDPETYAENAVPGPGLWMWRNVQYRGYRDHEGGYDADMDGDWEPATQEDVLRMAGSISAAEDDVMHYIDEHIEDPVGTYIAMAQAIMETRKIAA